jgi:hypothetical protein
MKKIIVTESQMKFIIENEDYINQLIDKIGQSGRDSLTVSEKKYLEGLSSHEGPLKYYQGPADEYSMYDYQRGERIKSNLPNIPEMEFKYDYQEVDKESGKNEILIFGSIFFGGEEYYGYIAATPDGNLVEYEFQIGEIGYDLLDDYENLMDELQGLEHEFEAFLEESVIPRFV